MKMKLSFRWYGEDDPVSLEYISQIPGMRSIVSAVYDVKPGEVWSEESIKRLTELCKEKGLVRSEGKEYIVKDGDLLNFLFNV